MNRNYAVGMDEAALVEKNVRDTNRVTKFIQCLISKSQTCYICKPCPGGEIGRRTVFRWQHPKGCAGSNPVPGTELKFRQSLWLPFYLND